MKFVYYCGHKKAKVTRLGEGVAPTYYGKFAPNGLYLTPKGQWKTSSGAAGARWFKYEKHSVAGDTTVVTYRER